MIERCSRFETALRPVFTAGAVAHPQRARHARALAFLALGALALGSSADPALASTQLSDGQLFSDIYVAIRPQISPDGQYAVYVQDARIDNAFELWSVRLDNTTPPVRLSGPLISGQIPVFQISSGIPAWVVYRVDQDMLGMFEVYSIPIDGSPPRIQLNPNMAANRDVYGFRISPRGDRVFYISDQESSLLAQLYSVPITGGTPADPAVRLNYDLDQWPDHDVASFQVSPVGNTVVYSVWRNAGGGLVQLWSVPALGPLDSAVMIDIDLSLTGGEVEDSYQISADSQTVVYTADATVIERFDLYSVPIHGSVLTPTQLNTGPANDTSVQPTFLISPDPGSPSPRVVFRAATSGQVFNLYSVPLGGGTVVPLNGALGALEDVEAGFGISANGSKVVYRSDEGTDNVYELYSVPIDGGTPIPLNGELVSGGDVLGSPSSPDFLISPDSARVVYLADQNLDTVNELFSVPIGGGIVTTLNRTLTSPGDVQAFRISPDSNWVVYGADQDVDTIDKLLAVPIDGPGPPDPPINVDATPGDHEATVVFTPGSDNSVQDVNGFLVSGGDVVLTRGTTPAFEISSNNLDVLYAADEVVDNEIELYVSSLGDNPITVFTVYSNPPGGVDSQAGSRELLHVVTNLMNNGTEYTFTVRATNDYGEGAPSEPSDPVTPACALFCDGFESGNASAWTP